METINFCELPKEILIEFLTILGEDETLKETDMNEKYKGDKCIERKWGYYTSSHWHQVVVTPNRITSVGHISIVIMTDEKFLKLSNLFKKV